MAVRSLSSVLKTLQVCDVVANSTRPLRLADVAQVTGEARGSTYQRLVTLVDAGWLEVTEAGRFRLSLGLYLKTANALEQAEFGVRIGDELHSLMIETGETASLVVLDGAVPVIIRREETKKILRADLRVGTRMSLSDSASGRAFSAFADEATLGRLKASGARMANAKVLAATRARGFAESNPVGPDKVGAVAAPVFGPDGRCIAAIALSCPLARFNGLKLGPVAARTAARISRQIGKY